MKKTITLALLCAFAFSAMAVTTKKKVAYFNKTYRDYEASGRITAPVDPILVMLNADSNFEVTYFDIDTVGTTPRGVFQLPANLDGFDVIVSQESFTGGDPIICTNGLLHLNTVNKPILFNKSYVFQAGRMFPSAASGVGAPSHAPLGVVNFKVEVANQSNPLFRGITFDANGEFKVLNSQIGDDGNAGTNGLNYVLPGAGILAVTDSNSNTINVPLAIPGAASVIPAVTVPTNIALCFNDIAKGSKIGNATNYITTQARVINIGVIYAAILKPGNLTGAGLTLFRNSIYSLASLAIPATGVPTAISKVENNKFSYTTSNNQLQLNFGSIQKAKASLYTVAGVLVDQKSVSADMVSFSIVNKGVYLVKVQGDKFSGTQKVIIK